MNPDRNVRYFIAYCAGLILGYALYIPDKTLPGFPAGGPGDFTAFYTAAQIIRSGSGARLYDLDLQSQVQQSYLVPHGWKFEGGLLPYINPPFFALLLVPLTLVPLAWAYHLWNLVNLSIILFCVRSATQGPARRMTMAVPAVIVFSFFPVFEGLWQGQSSFLVLLAFTLWYRALRNENEGVAGFALALGLIKPQLMLAPLAGLVFLRRWRMLAALGLAGMILLLASFACVGSEGLASYVTLSASMLKWAHVRGMNPTLMPNLRGTAHRLSEWLGLQTGEDIIPMWLSLLTLVCGLLIFMFLLGIWRREWRLGRDNLDLCVAQMLICSLLLSPHLNGHDLSLLVLAGFVVARYLEHKRKDTERNAVISLGHIGVTMPRLLSVALAFWAQGVALFLIACLVLLARESDRGPTPRARDLR